MFSINKNSIRISVVICLFHFPHYSIKSTGKHRKSPKITENHRKSPKITENHRKSPKITGIHRKIEYSRPIH
uniref:Uncharacterized protein n=1 Tax=viral metagenome TaxID=1070528 RepID=A0A6C0D682_9ZZZZ